MKSVFRSALCAGLLVFAGPAFAASHEKGPEPLKISHGEEVTLADYLVPGKTTVFDFSSEFCPPCRAVSPKLDGLHKKRADLAVVKIDINRPNVKGIDWKSPVARQYNVKSVPNFKVYSPEGKLVAEGKEAWDLVYGWVE